MMDHLLDLAVTGIEPLLEAQREALTVVGRVRFEHP
jgi:hypothetical protein